jgi:hypothetical protein
VPGSPAPWASRCQRRVLSGPLQHHRHPQPAYRRRMAEVACPWPGPARCESVSTEALFAGRQGVAPCGAANEEIHPGDTQTHGPLGRPFCCTGGRSRRGCMAGARRRCKAGRSERARQRRRGPRNSRKTCRWPSASCRTARRSLAWLRPTTRSLCQSSTNLLS